MDGKEITEYLGGAWKETVSLMHSALDTDVDLLRRTNEDILAHGGKQLRPVLCLLMARACGGGEVPEATVRYAAACELLHNATLIHDDVADSSEKRRGRPSVMSLIGPSGAVLLGDFWLARTVQTVLSGPVCEDVLRLFSKTMSDLAEGEMLQLQKSELADTTEEEYYRIIYCKTASLFEAACVSGAVSTGAPAEYVDAARSFARALGTAFQIKDDILDYEGTDEMGKPAGVDLREQKITLPLLGALKSCPEDGEIRQMVRNMHEDPSNEARIREFVIRSGGVAYAVARLDEQVDAAVAALGCLPPSEDRRLLSEIAVYVSTRNK